VVQNFNNYSSTILFDNQISSDAESVGDADNLNSSWKGCKLVCFKGAEVKADFIIEGAHHA